jgi:hypothetical protein
LFMSPRQAGQCEYGIITGSRTVGISDGHIKIGITAGRSGITMMGTATPVRFIARPVTAGGRTVDIGRRSYRITMMGTAISVRLVASSRTAGCRTTYAVRTT